MQKTPLEHRFTADSSYDAGLSPLFITLVKFPFHFKRSKCCFTSRIYATVALNCKLQEMVSSS